MPSSGYVERMDIPQAWVVQKRRNFSLDQLSKSPNVGGVAHLQMGLNQLRKTTMVLTLVWSLITQIKRH